MHHIPRSLAIDQNSHLHRMTPESWFLREFDSMAKGKEMISAALLNYYMH
jgi:hypothetical protein